MTTCTLTRPGYFGNRDKQFTAEVVRFTRTLVVCRIGETEVRLRKVSYCDNWALTTGKGAWRRVRFVLVGFCMIPETK